MINFAQFSETRKSYASYVKMAGGESNAIEFTQFCACVKWAKQDPAAYCQDEIEAAYKRLEFHGLNWLDEQYQRVEQSIRVWVALIDAIEHNAPSFLRHAVRVATNAGKLEQHAAIIRRVAEKINYELKI